MSKIKRNYSSVCYCERCVCLCFELMTNKSVYICDVVREMNLNSSRKVHKMISTIRNALAEYHLGYEIICIRSERKYILVDLFDENYY